MYDGKSQFLIRNPINRYLINSPMLPVMKENADGSLTLYIQKDSPGQANEANWLPAPNGTIYLVMRLYWPKDTPPSILPVGEGTWKPPMVVASKSRARRGAAADRPRQRLFQTRSPGSLAARLCRRRIRAISGAPDSTPWCERKVSLTKRP
jgi:hypothetical protein